MKVNSPATPMLLMPFLSGCATRPFNRPAGPAQLMGQGSPLLMGKVFSPGWTQRRGSVKYLAWIAVGALACGGGSDGGPMEPEPPPPVAIAGNYSGTLTFEPNDCGFTVGSFSVNVTHTPGSRSFTMTFTGGAVLQGSLSEVDPNLTDGSFSATSNNITLVGRFTGPPGLAQASGFNATGRQGLVLDDDGFICAVDVAIISMQAMRS